MLLLKSRRAERHWQLWYSRQIIGWIRLASLLNLMHVPIAWSQLSGKRAWLAGNTLFLFYFTMERVSLEAPTSVPAA